MDKLIGGLSLAVFLSAAFQISMANENLLDKVADKHELKYQRQMGDGCSDDLDSEALTLAKKANQEFWIKGKTHNAVKQLEQAIALEPRLYSGYTNLKVHYCWALKQCDKAVNLLKSGVAHCPLWPGHHEDLAATYSRMGKHAQAIKEYAVARKKGITETPSLFYNIGNSEAQLKLHREAIVSYQKALGLDAKHFYAHKNLIVTYVMLNQKEQALKQIQTLLSLTQNQKILAWANDAKRRLSQ